MKSKEIDYPEENKKKLIHNWSRKIKESGTRKVD
jgi:hypothetical protein